MPDVARQFVAANGQYIYRNSALLSSFHEYTISAWVYLQSTDAVTRIIFSLASSTIAPVHWKMARATDDTPFLSMRTNTGELAVVNAMGNLKYGIWKNVVATCNSLGVIHVWLDGGNMGSGETVGLFWTMDRSAIGALLQAVASEFWNGRIFWPAMWDVVLSDGEIAQLAAHERPSNIQAANLISFPDLSDLSDTYAGSPWLNNGTTIVAPPPWIPYSTVGERLFMVGGDRDGLFIAKP